jgi:hypothetical protein
LGSIVLVGGQVQIELLGFDIEQLCSFCDGIE